MNKKRVRVNSELWNMPIFAGNGLDRIPPTGTESVSALRKLDVHHMRAEENLKVESFVRELLTQIRSNPSELLSAISCIID